MIVYHGSYMEIAEVDLSKCEPHKDFGQGFTETDAIDIFYKSDTFARLTEKNSSLLSLSWTEIYHLFLQEIQKEGTI